MCDGYAFLLLLCALPCVPCAVENRHAWPAALFPSCKLFCHCLGPQTALRSIMATTMALAFAVVVLIKTLFYSLFMSAFACVAAIFLLTIRHLHSSEHSPNMSPDTVSTLFPDRPIRPLPKRRLRERLSPEAADTIKYPPSTHDAVPLFYYPPYTLKDEGSPSSVDSYSPLPAEQGRRIDSGRNYTPRRNKANRGDGEEEEPALRSTLVARSPPEILSRAANRSSRSEQPRHADPQPPPSTTSSVDGYDSFENASNKKKRKIPSAGDSALNGTHALNSDIGSLAISVGAHSPASDMNGDRPSGYPGSGTFMPTGQGISGSGRGRLGMSRNGRSPLRALADGNNTWAPRTPKPAPPQWMQQPGSYLLFVFSSLLEPSLRSALNLVSVTTLSGRALPTRAC